MCHFISAILPAVAELSALRAIAQEHALSLTELQNPHVQEQLRPDERYYLTTTGHCDCGTVLGSAIRCEKRAHTTQPTESQIVGLRRRGWSKTKIERWLSQQSVTAARDTRVEQVHHESRMLEAEMWQQFLNAALDRARTPYLGLLLHWYHGSIEGERIHLHRRSIVLQRNITPEILTRLPEDELYIFSRSNNQSLV